METRVYVINCDESKIDFRKAEADRNIYSIQTEAERLGTVYTLKGFQKAINDEELFLTNSFILIAEPINIQFTCPECKTHRLECCEEGPYSSEVLEIDEDGDFDYGEIDASGNVVRFQCLNCGYILSREDGSPIDNNEEVVEWIKDNYPG